MARLQILELPTEHHGDDMVTPLVLVIDQHRPLRYVAGIGMEEQAVDEFEGIAEKIGARAVLVFSEAVEIPANEPAVQAELPLRVTDFAELAEVKQLTEARDEARLWARHGYEIGQRHCSWSDHGVAPAWLTEGWSHHFDSCEHLARASEYDMAISRALQVADELEAADVHGSAYDANQEAAARIRAVLRPSVSGGEPGSTS